MQPDTDYRLKPTLDLVDDWWLMSWVVWVTLLPVSILISVVFVDPSRSMLVMTAYWAIVWALLPSLTVGLFLAMLKNRTAPLMYVFWPTRARLLNTFGFWMVLPVSCIGIFPISAGFIGFYSLSHPDRNLHWGGVSPDFAFNLLGVSYLIACLLCHNLPHIGKRLAAYTLIWLGICSIPTAMQMLLFP